jgi:hypothetical protein
MTIDVDWVTSAITKARGRSAPTPEAVWVQIESLLRGRFGDRPIPAKELASIALQLIDDMAPTLPPTEGPL